jgi:hypothetical protein
MAQVPNQILRLVKTQAGAKYLGLEKISASDFIEYCTYKLNNPNLN